MMLMLRFKYNDGHYAPFSCGRFFNVMMIQRANSAVYWGLDIKQVFTLWVVLGEQIRLGELAGLQLICIVVLWVPNQRAHDCNSFYQKERKR